jgi:putative ABC transport system permease protein
VSELHGRVQRQVQLPFRRVFEIAWKNIRVRLFRSLLVTSGIILALAFLTYILCSDAVLRSVKKDGSPELVEKLKKDGLLGAPAADPDDPDAEDQVSEADKRAQTWWLVGLALMVAFVGILNAMLLSVTERYAEIGTMKCLGALDFLIVELFLLESTMQGIVGTGIGVIIGLALTFGEGWSAYGGAMWGLIPWAEIVKLIGVCMLAGTFLTIVGALYPAWRAAKMQPVDAMRAEI